MDRFPEKMKTYFVNYIYNNATMPYSGIMFFYPKNSQPFITLFMSAHINFRSCKIVIN
jgi:hypothetical protein